MIWYNTLTQHYPINTESRMVIFFQEAGLLSSAEFSGVSIIPPLDHGSLNKLCSIRVFNAHGTFRRREISDYLQQAAGILLV